MSIINNILKAFLEEYKIDSPIKLLNRDKYKEYKELYQLITGD